MRVCFNSFIIPSLFKYLAYRNRSFVQRTRLQVKERALWRLAGVNDVISISFLNRTKSCTPHGASAVVHNVYFFQGMYPNMYY